MRVIVVGATGTIGNAIVEALGASHQIVPVSHRRSPVTVDLADKASIRRMFETVGRIDVVISAAGLAKFGPFGDLTDEDFELGLRNKLMGQVNLVRVGLDHVTDGGSFTLTSGVLSRKPAPGSVAISLVNAGLEGYVRAAALEMPRGIRINVVSPGWVRETLEMLGMDPAQGTPAAVVARAYVESVEGTSNGEVLDVEG